MMRCGHHEQPKVEWQVLTNRVQIADKLDRHSPLQVLSAEPGCCTPEGRLLRGAACDVLLVASVVMAGTEGAADVSHSHAIRQDEPATRGNDQSVVFPLRSVLVFI